MPILTKAQLEALNQVSFPNNNANYITPEILRNYNTDVIDTLVDSNDTGSFARTNLTNTFTQTNNFAAVSASSFVSASNFIGDGSRLTNITSSIALPILDEGVPVGNAVSMNFSGSAISAYVAAGVAIVSVNALDSASFNAYTASNDAKVNSLIAKTGSYATTGSNNFIGDQHINGDLYISGTHFIDIGEGSFRIVDAGNDITLLDAQKGVQLRNFTANDIIVEQFANAAITIDNNSGSVNISAHNLGQGIYLSASVISLNNIDFNSYSSSVGTKISGLNTSASLALYTASFDTGSRNLTFTKGNTTQFSVNIPDVSGSSNFTTTASFNAYTQSNDAKVNSLINATGSYATTASFNSYTQSNNQRVSSLETNSASVNISISNLNAATSSYITNAQTASMSVATASVALAVSTSISTQNLQHFVTFVDNSTGTQALYVDGGIKYNPNQDLLLVNNISSSGYISGSSLKLTGTLTASLASGYAWVGNGSNISTLVATSSFGGGSSIDTGSFATTGSNSFVATQTITGSVNITGQYLINGVAISGSNISQFATTGSNSFNGNQTITGSLIVSNTFTASLANGYTYVGNGSNRTVLVATSSFGTTTNTGSLLVTASFSTNTGKITFNKGDGSSFLLPSSSINPNMGFITTGTATKAKQTILGDFTFDTRYTTAISSSAQDNGVNTLYLDYNFVFNDNYDTFNYWNYTSNYQGVSISGTGIVNGTVTGYGYGNFFEVYFTSGATTNGLTYTLTGPTVQNIDLLGSLSATYQMGIIAPNGNTVLMDAASGIAISQQYGFYTAGIGGGLISVGQPTAQLSLATTSSLIGGGQLWEGPQIAISDGLNGPISNIGFQGANNYTDGRVTILTPLVAQSGSVITGSLSVSGSTTLRGNQTISGSLSMTGSVNFTTGSNKQAGTATLNGANPGTVTVSNSLVTGNSIILLTRQDNNNANAGPAIISAKSAGTFTITTNHNGDAGVIGWFIINNS